MSQTPTSFLDKLRGLFGGGATDGRLRSTVDATQAVQLVADGAALVDVREASEWRSGHAPQAVHVALGEIAKAPRRLRQDQPVLVICASGARSRVGAKQLRDLGFDAASVSGGMGAWQRAGGTVRR